jgi:phage replication-related protein YjqB (UPF0714/DUF867 family)
MASGYAPFAEAARATRAVISGISGHGCDCIDTGTPSHDRTRGDGRRRHPSAKTNCDHGYRGVSPELATRIADHNKPPTFAIYSASALHRNDGDASTTLEFWLFPRNARDDGPHEEMIVGNNSIRRCLPSTLGVIALGASMVFPTAARGAVQAAPRAAVAGVSWIEKIRSDVTSDKYGSYAQLAAHESEGRDYRRVQRFPIGVKVAHIAIHGGSIEAPTTQLASHSASARGFAYYSFEGIKESGNSDLHITSDRFDEPRALKLVARVDYTVSWHGASGAKPTTYVGGRDVALIRKITTELRAAGFTVAKFIPDELAGKSQHNIANKNRRGKGVQLEISSGQRERFFAGGKLSRAWIENPANRTNAFYRYTAAVNRALAGF